MQGHVDDLDLLALASPGAPPAPRVRMHLASCPACRERQAGLLGLLPPVPEPHAAPPWDAVRPLGLRPRPRRRLTAPIAAALMLTALLVWPYLVWRSAPNGPVALLALASARSVASAQGGVRSELTVSRLTGWALLMAGKLPRLPAGYVYEAWWIRGTRHVPAGVFTSPPSGTISLWLPSPADFRGVQALGVTVEPAPGSAFPTSPRVLYQPLPRVSP
jgi:hypothetical protein